MRPQYSRPHSTVDTTVKPANRYQARLYLKIGRFQSSTPKTLTIGDELALEEAQVERPTPTSVMYFSRTLLRKKLTSARTRTPRTGRGPSAWRGDDVAPSRLLLLLVVELPASRGRLRRRCRRRLSGRRLREGREVEVGGRRRTRGRQAGSASRPGEASLFGGSARDTDLEEGRAWTLRSYTTVPNACRAMPAATVTLSESTGAAIGIVTLSSAAASAASVRPAPSAPASNTTRLCR